MAECYKCGAENVRLSDVISKEGVVKICDFCLKEDDFPLLRRPTSFQLKEAEVPNTVYERLSGIAGINAVEHKKKFSPEFEKKALEKKKEDVTLKDLVEKNYQKRIGNAKVEPKPDLIDNFHWIIMRARRMKKLSQEQVAIQIAESKAAIEMAEKGILPDNYSTFVSKLESFLGIKIRKKQEGEVEQRINLDKLKFDKQVSRALTIADLKELKAEQDTKFMSNELKEDISLNEEFKGRLDNLRK